jgi:amidase
VSPADDAVAFAGIARHAEMLRAREVSSRELTELYLARIERLEPQLNAFRVVLAEKALEQADAADKKLAGGGEGALLGVPLALKDTVDLAGELTCFGTGGFDEPATSDAEMVQRLREAGAVFVGKTNLPELAIFGFTESKTWGITRNPWNLDRTPGGSSGGSGAAVAAGLIGAATASDGAGSIRIPAANCGLFGLKPQYARVPLAPYADHWVGLSVNGCLTRSVLDSALFLDIVGAGGGDPGGPPPPERPFVESAKTPPGQLRIATSHKAMRAAVPPIVRDEVKRAVDQTGELLRSLGHRVHRDDPAMRSSGNNLTIRYLAGIHEDVEMVPHPERLEPRTRGFGKLGGRIPKGLVERARRDAAKDGARVGKVFENADILVMPTVGEPPVPVGHWDGMGAFRNLIGMSRTYCFTPLWNHLGNPAASVPMGFTNDGLPLSVQLIGRPADEATLLSLAAQIEAERPWAERRPPVS